MKPIRPWFGAEAGKPGLVDPKPMFVISIVIG